MAFSQVCVPVNPEPASLGDPVLGGDEGFSGGCVCVRGS